MEVNCNLVLKKLGQRFFSSYSRLSLKNRIKKLDMVCSHGEKNHVTSNPP